MLPVQAAAALDYLQEVTTMTIDPTHTSITPYLTAADVAAILHCDPQLLRQQAHQNPHALGFPVIIIGRRVRIPRAAFVRFMEEVCNDV